MILLHKPKMSGFEMDFIAEAIKEDWAVPLGPDVTALEEELSEILFSSRCSEVRGGTVALVNSGTAAMHLALLAAGVKAGDEVMVQSFTFSASCNPIVYIGAKPVFIDSENETWNMDPDLLEAAIKDRIAKTGRKPAAIVPVALYGMPYKAHEILEIAHRYEIPVVEDAAEALGSRYEGKFLGTIGDFGILSFNGNKMITTSGGGAVVCPDKEAKEKIIWYATQARESSPWYQHEVIGYNYRLSNISACIGRAQLKVLDNYLDHHKKIHQLYKELFSSGPFGEAPGGNVMVHDNPSPIFDSNFWLTTITFPSLASMPCKECIGREPGYLVIEEIRQKMREAHIETRHLWKPMHLQPVYKDAPAYINGVSEKLFNMGLCLPSGPYVTEEDARTVASTLFSILGSIPAITKNGKN